MENLSVKYITFQQSFMMQRLFTLDTLPPGSYLHGVLYWRKYAFGNTFINLPEEFISLGSKGLINGK